MASASSGEETIRPRQDLLYVWIPIISLCRVEENRPPLCVKSSQYRGGVLSPDWGMNTIPYPTEVYRGVSYPWGCIGCKWREGVTHLLLLRGMTSRLISFHFLSFHPRASAASAKCMCVCMWTSHIASYSFPGDVVNRAENDAVGRTYASRSFSRRCESFSSTDQLNVNKIVNFIGIIQLNRKSCSYIYYLKMCAILNVILGE